jgi:hypothetical protein
MSKKEKEQTITINDTEYKASDLTNEQIVMVNHINDLDRKLDSAKFNLDQLQIGRNAFMNMLTNSLENPVEEAEVEAA